MRPILLFLVVAGCYPTGPGEVNVTIDSFTEMYITVTEQSFDIVVGKRDAVDQAEPCPRVDASLTGRLGETPVPVISRGGKIGTDPGDDVDDNFCGIVELRLDGPPPAGPTVLQLSDATTTVTCSIPDLQARRSLTQTPESDPWQWRSGQAVTVQWSPSGDLPRWSTLLTELVPDPNPMGIDGAEIRDATRDGDLLHFTVPSVAPGSYKLSADPWGYASCTPHPTSVAITAPTAPFAPHHAVMIVP